ncbi:hypothetical protein [Brevibacterium sp. FME37]|uniref:hypothetical protein n=1 Tax=Brevibacterium sp. FME37 TaxID=2742607 RepID=UPI001869320D|nr:hypothetical protein [Brevibacterium sp. FME37]
MLSKWKVLVITGLFVFGALSFILGLFPLFADIFWILWFAGCGACILALILTVIVPSPRSAENRRAAGTSVSGHPAACRTATGPADGISRP